MTKVLTDYLDPRDAEGMPNMIDSSIALDFLLATKNGIRNLAFALGESASDEVREAFKKILYDTLEIHDEIVELMLSKGWLHPFNLEEQLKMDMKASTMAVKIAKMKLFQENTNRLGTFATPKE